MHHCKSQKGMTAIGWLLVLSMVAIFVLVGIRLIPIYITGYEISTAMNQMATDASLHGKSPPELKKALLFKLDIQGVYDIKSDDIVITRDQGGYSIEVDFEPRVSLLGNLYFVAVFDKTVVVPSN